MPSSPSSKEIRMMYILEAMGSSSRPIVYGNERAAEQATQRALDEEGGFETLEGTDSVQEAVCQSMAGVKKKRRVEEAWWDRNTASSAPTSTLLSLSHDQQRLRQHTRIVDLTPVPAQEDNDNDDQQTQDSYYSSDYDYSDFGGDWQGEESSEYARFWEALNESGVTEDAILQALNRTEQAQAAQVDIKTMRRFNLHSVGDESSRFSWLIDLFSGQP
ncbi:hypothetical protein VKT23_015437 [Stygiomarasmius scandens]|uniref:Uncharacterized protein n=1 Tax=Marasmiellus scandens TaxID=2682957 RepID=A0ABR1J272_9AGAR